LPPAPTKPETSPVARFDTNGTTPNELCRVGVGKRAEGGAGAWGAAGCGQCCAGCMFVGL
jgi:hypothetical protein